MAIIILVTLPLEIDNSLKKNYFCALMRRTSLQFGLVLVVGLMVLSGCKTEFERIRVSGDPQQMYEKGMAYYAAGDYLRAQTLLELAIPSFRGRKEGEELFFKYAYTQYYLGKYILAAYYFDNFSTSFGGSILKEEAEFMAAYSNYQLSPSFRLDQTYTEKAIDAFQEFANTYPQSERLTEVNRLIDQMRRKLEEKAFYNAQLYYDLRQYQSAIQSFENLLKDFPETLSAEKVRYLVVKSYFLLADNSILEKRAERFRDTVKACELFIKKYPESTFREELEGILETADKKLKSLEDV